MICYLFSEPVYFLFSSDAPALLYYSHIPTAAVAIIVGLFVFLKGRHLLLNRLLFGISVCFSLWVISNLILWTNVHGDLMLFVWSFLRILNALISVLSIYFIYVFLEKKDVSLLLKSVFLILTAPIIVLAPTSINLGGFDITNCDAFMFEGPLFQFSRIFFGVLAMAWILVLLVRKYRTADADLKKQIMLVGTGIELFLFSFFMVTFFAAYLTDMGILSDSRLEYYGLFGMAVFVGFLAYLIVHYEAFNVKLIGAQVLVWALWILVFGLSLLNDLTTIRIISALTLLLLIGFGLALVRSVKAEVERRQKLQTLSAELKDFNTHLEEKIKEQTEDIHRAYETEKRSREELESLAETKNRFIVETEKHLREPLTTIQHGFASLGERLENTTLSETTHATLASMADGVSRLQKLVNEFLDISQLAVGKGILTIKPLEVPPLLSEITRKLAPQTVKKDLTLRMSVDPSAIGVEALADRTKFTQALAEITENAMKHSREKGTVTITASAHPHPIEKTLIYRVEITNETDRDIADIRPLLEGSGSQGVGLALVREVVRAHDGRLGIEEREPRHLTIFLEVRGTKNSA